MRNIENDMLHIEYAVRTLREMLVDIINRLMGDSQSVSLNATSNLISYNKLTRYTDANSNDSINVNAEFTGKTGELFTYESDINALNISDLYSIYSYLKDAML